MKTRELISGLKKARTEKGHRYVADKMGYRSTVAQYLWIKDGKIPEIAKDKVIKFLQRERKKSA